MMPRYNPLEAAYLNTPAESVTQRAALAAPSQPAEPVAQAGTIGHIDSGKPPLLGTVLAHAAQAAQQPIPAMFYMRDNHTFRKLPENMDEALATLAQEWDAGFTSGGLCTKRPGADNCFDFIYTMTREEMTAKARQWLEVEITARQHPAAEQAAAEGETPLRKQALALYTPPFRFERGYIWDANSLMVADDDAQDVALRVRGWGLISYQPNPEALQDEVGRLMAEALTQYWQAARRPVRELTDAEIEDVFSRYWHHQWQDSGGARLCQIKLTRLVEGARALLSKATGEGK